MREFETIVSVSAKSLGEALQQIRAAPQQHTWEVRLDAMWPTVPDASQAAATLSALRDASGASLLATLRPRRQGGGFDGPEEVRLGLLAAALAAGWDAVDLEDDLQDPGLVRSTILRNSVHDPAAHRVASQPPPAKAAVILSRHAHLAPDCRSDGLAVLRRQKEHGGDLQKYVYPWSSFLDTVRSLELARVHHLEGGRPCVLPLGAGADVRALLALAGNRAVYGHDGMAATAGQPRMRDIQEIWDHWGLKIADFNEIHPIGLVVGHPVAHSRSPRIHNAAYRDLGMPHRFGALDVPASAGALRLLMHAAPKLGVTHLSVTSPHKVDALGMAQADAVATQTGAANCIRFDGPLARSTNTDATALRRLMAGHVDRDSTVAILGAGGAARAAHWAARQLGARTVVVCRDASKPQWAQRVVPWADGAQLRPTAWVQATRLGSDGRVDDEPAARPASWKGCRLVIELVYARGPTPFEELARGAGVKVVDGRDVLLAQALDAFQFWHDRSAPAGVLRQALGGPV